MTSYIEAIDSMYSVFKAAWDAQASGILGYTPSVNYDEADEGNQASLEQVFARLTVRNALEGLLSVGGSDDNTKLYATQGILIVQIFVPKHDNSSWHNSRRLAMMVRNAYRKAGADGEVWYKNATILEQPPDKRWRQVNINVEYDFTETI